jgi:hypothetical protein
MFNLFTRQPSNDNNSQSDEDQSSINLDFKASVKIKGELLIKLLLPWLLGGSVCAGIYSISNFLSSSNTEVNNDPNQKELVKKSSNLRQTE